MAYKVKIEGNESFELAKECVNSVFLSTDIPIDSNARTNDAGATIEINGKFTLLIKQKKDKMAGLIVEGGYAAE